MHLLPTDMGLIAMTAGLGLYAYKVCCHPPSQVAWKNIVASRLGRYSLSVFMLFWGIAFIDSMHLTDSTSLLDHWLAHLTSSEQTYSPPFAHFNDTTSLTIGPVPLEHINPLTPSLLIQNLLWLLLPATLLLSLLHSIKKACPILHGFLHALLLLFTLTATLLMLSQHYHILGTNKIGDDVFYGCLKSIRTGMVIALITPLFSLPIAVFLGALAGFIGGKIDDGIQFLYTTLSAIPGVLLISAAVLTLQISMTQHPTWFASLEARADARLLALCLILALTGWTPLCRLIRAEVLKLKTLPYIECAKTMGQSTFYIIIKHLLPNVGHLILITAALDFSALVLAEAVLSYIGVGVDPTMLSWGNMINASRLELARSPTVWWPLLGSFGFMLTLVLSANLLAECLQRHIKPPT